MHSMRSNEIGMDEARRMHGKSMEEHVYSTCWTYDKGEEKMRKVHVAHEVG